MPEPEVSDLKTAEIIMPDLLKQDLGMISSVDISEDSIKLTLYNPGSQVIQIWIYNTAKEEWSRIILR